MRHLLLLILGFFSLLSLVAQPQADEKFGYLDVFELQYVSEPRIAPDGERIVYVHNFKDVMTDRNLSNLWIINYDGTEHLPLTTGQQSDRQPRWSPDGQRLAFLSDRDGRTQVYLYWLEGGQLRRLSNLTASPSGLQWSPDGQYLALSMPVAEQPSSLVELPAKPEGAQWAEKPIYIDALKYRSDGQGYLKAQHQQLFLLDTESGHLRQLTDEPFDHGGDFTWTPDGKSLIFSANRHADAELNPRNSELYRLDLASGEITALTDREGPDFNPAVSPDGRYLAYLGYDEQYLGYQQAKPYLMDLVEQRTRPFATELDRNFENLQWDATGKGVFFQYDNQGDTKIAYLSLEGKVSEVTDQVGGLSLGRPYSGGSFHVAAGGRFAYTLSGPHHPAELGVGLYPRGGTGRLTQLNQGLFSHKNLGQVEEIWFESTYDGREIQGWLVFPPDFDPEKKYPLLLEIHGGPFANYGGRFSAEMQLYAAAGYVVLYMNPRGSTSYGAEFANLIHHNYPSQDYDDLMSAVFEMVTRSYVDKDNLFITGGSGGGVLTAWTIGQTDVFRAAVVAKPVINWYSFVLYADNPAFFYKYWFPGFPWDTAHTQQYLDRSPLSLVGNVTTPTMLLTGEQDYRTPIAESEQYYTALKLQGVDAAMVRIPEASHGIAGKPSQLIAKVAYILGWFAKYRR